MSSLAECQFSSKLKSVERLKEGVRKLMVIDARGVASCSNYFAARFERKNHHHQQIYRALVWQEFCR